MAKTHTEHIPALEMSMLSRDVTINENYLDDCAKLATHYPIVRERDPRRWLDPTEEVTGRLVQINFDDQGRPNILEHQSPEDLDHELLYTPTDQKQQRRLFILEGVHQKWTTVLGSHLRVPHTVWSRHEKVGTWESKKEAAGNVPPLPTSVTAFEPFVLRYVQLQRLNIKSQVFNLRCAENERHIASSRSIGRLDGVGALYRKATYWAKPVGRSGWDALLVVDEPFSKAITGKRHDWTYVVPYAPPEPYQGGFVNFVPFANLDEALRTEGPPHTSTLDSLLHYYENHWNLLKLTADPHSVAIFVEKIIASEYMLVLEYQRTLLSDLHWYISRHENFEGFGAQWIASCWSDLMAFQRRLQDYRRDVRGIKLHLQSINMIGVKERRDSLTPMNWHDTAADFDHVESVLTFLLGRVEKLVTAFNALSGIRAAENALLEARSVHVLTLIGLIFLPLSLVATIFSMSGDYNPGQSKFWIYVLFAIPLTGLVILLAFGWPIVLRKWQSVWERVAPRRSR